MKQNYIILRSPTAVAPDPFRGPFPLPTAAPPLGASLLVEVEHIDRQRIPALTEKER